jgi:hypothetical protein
MAVVLVPCLIYVFRRLLSWWYHRKISRDETKLQKLKVGGNALGWLIEVRGVLDHCTLSTVPIYLLEPMEDQQR